MADSSIQIALKALDEFSPTIVALNQGIELIKNGLMGINLAGKAAFGVIGLVATGITTLTSIALSPFILAFDAIKYAANAVYDAVTGTLNYMWDTTKNVAGYIYDSLTSVAGYLWDSVKEAGAALWDYSKQFASALLSSFNSVGNQFQQLGVKMETIFGGSGPADKALKWAAEFGAKTPLTLDQVGAAMIKLKTFGFDPMDGTLQKLGDTAFALGSDFDGIVTALGQMQLKGKVSAEELMQLAERNVPVYDILREKFNLTAEQLGNIGKVGLDVNEAVKAIVDGLGTRFSGAMAKAANTVQGSFSTIDDILTVFQKKILDAGVWDTYTNYIIKVRDTLDRYLNSWSGQELARNIGSLLNDIVKFATSSNLLEEGLKFVIDTAPKAIKALQAGVKVVVADLTSVFDVVNAWFKETFNKSNTSSFIDTLIAAVTKGYSQVKIVIDGLRFWGGLAISEISSGIEKTISFVTNLHNIFSQAGVYDRIINAFRWLYDTLPKLAQYAADFIQSFDFANITQQAAGMFNDVYDYLANTFTYVINNFESIYKQAVAIIKGIIGYVIDGYNQIITVIQKLNPGNLFSGTVAVLTDIFKMVVAVVATTGEAVAYIVKGASTVLFDIVEESLKALQAFIKNSPKISAALGLEAGSLDSFIKDIKSAQTAAEDFAGTFKTGFAGFRDVSETLLSGVSNSISGFNQTLEGLKIDVNSPFGSGFELPKLKLDFDPVSVAQSLQGKIQTELTVKVNTGLPQDQNSVLPPDSMLLQWVLNVVKNGLISLAGGEGAPIVAFA